MLCIPLLSFFFFFNDTATTEIYTLSLHDALPICHLLRAFTPHSYARRVAQARPPSRVQDRKSTRLNSSHSQISYAVFCLKKKKQGRCYALLSRRTRSALRQRTRLHRNHTQPPSML